MNGQSQSPGPQASILDLSWTGLQAQMAIWREPGFRAKQIWDWVYRRAVDDFGDMTNLPKALRERLAQVYRVSPLRALDELVSSDLLTRKLLFGLSDGATIESVLMAYDRRQTVCVSSQAGCPVGCAFCATGQGGFTRNLSAGEIIAQVLYFQRELREQEQSVTHVVVMGMGEPLINYDAVWQAVETWNDERGLKIGARRITISTAGHVPGIRQLAQESLQVGLAVSLHAADDELRDTLVPLNRTYPLAELLDACAEYIALTNRRVTVEYALIDGVNDAVGQAHQLADLLEGMLCHVNLIPLNPTEKSAYRPSPGDQVLAFHRALLDRHIQTTVRLRRGIDIQAGCGQLWQRGRGRGSDAAESGAPMCDPGQLTVS